MCIGHTDRNQRRRHVNDPSKAAALLRRRSESCVADRANESPAAGTMAFDHHAAAAIAGRVCSTSPCEGTIRECVRIVGDAVDALGGVERGR